MHRKALAFLNHVRPSKGNSDVLTIRIYRHPDNRFYLVPLGESDDPVLANVKTLGPLRTLQFLAEVLWQWGLRHEGEDEDTIAA